MGNLAYKDDGYANIREELRYEILNGKVTAMAPTSIAHADISVNLAIIFRRYLKGKTCRYLSDGPIVRFSEKDKFIPDGMVLCGPEKIQNSGSGQHVVGIPDLVVEILSRSTAKNDYVLKKKVYEVAGVREYWIVDPVNCFISVYLLREGKLMLDNVYAQKPNDDEDLKKLLGEEAFSDELHCSIFPDLRIPLAEIFNGPSL